MLKFPTILNAGSKWQLAQTATQRKIPKKKTRSKITDELDPVRTATTKIAGPPCSHAENGKERNPRTGSQYAGDNSESATKSPPLKA
jgi:hypothetical protein